jgi:hypothetical protein
MSRPPHPPRLILLIYLTTSSTNYAAPRYALFSTLPSLHPSLVQIFYSTSCSQTPSVYVHWAYREAISGYQYYSCNFQFQLQFHRVLCLFHETSFTIRIRHFTLLDVPTAN